AAARAPAAARPSAGKSGGQYVQSAKAPPPASTHAAAHPAAGKTAKTATAATPAAAPASATRGADTTRVEPALKPKTARAAYDSAARPASAGAATAGSDADWETF
ncbi:MAG: methyl-accepting chemotaxis protein, partial [Paraburkholderia fungorum]